MLNIIYLSKNSNTTVNKYYYESDYENQINTLVELKYNLFPRKWKYTSEVKIPQNCTTVQYFSNCI